MPNRRTRAAATVTALVLAGGAATLLPGGTQEAAAGTLRPYTDCDDLLKRYRDALDRPPSRLYGIGAEGRTASGSAGSVSSDSAPQAASAPGTGEAVTPGPTGTNLQERGVDEPDSAKVSGGLLFALSESRLQVLRTGAQPRVLSTLPLGGSAYGAELLVQGDRVLVLLPGSGGGGAEPMVAEPMDGGPAGAISMPVPVSQGTRLLLVDVTEPTAPELLESLELDGRYLSARLSGGVVRLVTSSTPRLAPMEDGGSAGPSENRPSPRSTGAEQATLEQVLPSAVRRGAGGRVLSDGPAVGCEQVRYASGAEPSASTLLVTTLDLTRDLAAVDRTAVTTDGDLVYASTDRLYVATSRWGPMPMSHGAGDVTTEVHAFDTTSPTGTRYAGTASVDGTVLGRWAFSSYEGYLRVAVTLADSPAGTTSSSVVVFEERSDSLVETGRVDGLGPGERIYAVRYVGTLATVVTFRQTDPLYVLDLADPKNPRLLGELKVPGFSTYLHPVGDGRLLAVGQDATSTGRVTGLQVSLFDLSDRARPVQLDRMSLGRSSTPASQDSRAFGYDPSRRLALIPLTSDPDAGSGQEALGIRVTERGTLEEVGRLPAGTSAQVERVLFDDEQVYAVSRRGVTAGTAADLERTGAVAFRQR